MYKIIEIEGIGPLLSGVLENAGIHSTEDLLNRAASRKGREELSAQTGISQKLILGWVNRADLFRIKGVAEEYSDLLEVAGVDTVVELAKRNPDNLHAQLEETNKDRHLVRALPTLDDVRDWTRQAGKLSRVVTH